MQNIEHNNDFTLRLPVKGTDELSQVSNSFNKLVGKIHGSLEQILSGVREINAATGGLSTTASQVSASSAHQSESAAAMAAAVEELTVSIAHVSSNATIASDLAKESGKAVYLLCLLPPAANIVVLEAWYRKTGYSAKYIAAGTCIGIVAIMVYACALQVVPLLVRQ